MIPSGVTLDSAGNLYGTTSAGGFTNAGKVFEIAKGTGTITTLATFDSSTSGGDPRGGIALDSAGNLYGTTQEGSPGGGGTVFEIVAGSNTLNTLAVFNSANGGGPVGDMILDAAGDLYGTTEGGGAGFDGTVFEIPVASNALITLASFNGTNGEDPTAGVTLDSAGNLYGTTSGGPLSNLGSVFEIAKGSNAVTTLASFDGTNGGNPRGGVTLDSAGNLYGTTQEGGAGGWGTVFEIARGSNTVTTLASFSGTNEAAPEAGVTSDGAGNLYGTTYAGGYTGGSAGSPVLASTVFEIPGGSSTVTTLASFDGADGKNPIGGVTLDPNGNIYGTTSVGGPKAGTVFEIAKGNGRVTTLASFTGANGAFPYAGVTLDSTGNLYGTTEEGGAGTSAATARSSRLQAELMPSPRSPHSTAKMAPIRVAV